MKILLCEDIDKLGWLGDVVEVAEGYARNYLLPQRLATQATEANIRSIAEKKAERTEQRKLDGKRLEVAAKAVEGAEAVVAAKANEQGHLFGSVTAREIAANLREQGFQITDKMMQLPEHIKEVGTHTVELRFSEELTTTVNVVVVAEQDTAEAAEETSETADEAQKL
jgi:large subunit ribosomal protein L9